MKWRVLWLPLLALPGWTLAETVKDREGAVRKDKAAIESDSRWIYNDVPGAFAKARQTGRPLMVVLRCVPCVSCMDVDAQVLEPGGGLDSLLDQFVCARVINANALDLSLFQFDYDLSFAVMFFNADRTIYGRFGTRTQRDSRARDVTLDGFRHAIEGALELHRAYPANKAALAKKQGRASTVKTPREFPDLIDKYGTELDWGGNVVRSCIHCHQVREAERTAIWTSRKPIPDELIYVSPLPETIGLKLGNTDRARVVSVAEGSSAEKAGLRAGDDLIAFDGQPLISVADVQWALAGAPAGGTVPVVARRNGAETAVDLALTDGWRRNADISWRVTTWQLRGMVTGGLVLEDLGDDARSGRGISPEKLALAVKHVGQYGIHAAGKQAGFREGDVIVEVDGISNRMSESRLIGDFLQKRSPGDRVPMVVLRNDERVTLKLPIQ